MVQEISPDHPRLSAACNAAFEHEAEVLGSALVVHGVNPSDARLANLVIASLEGGLILCRAKESAEPLRMLAEDLAEVVRRTQASS